MTALWQDLRYGLRMLARSPGFAFVVVLSLALGIGANTAIFGLIDAALLKMLPVKDPEQLVHFTWVSADGSEDSFSFPTFKQLRDRNQVFAGVVAFRELPDVDFEVDGAAGLAKGQVVSGNYYSVLGVNAMLGRTITPEDDRVAGAGPVAVISYDYWVKRFNRDPRAVGKKITVNGSPFTVLGVTPPEFFGLQPGERIDVSMPLSMVTQVWPDWAAAGTPYSVLSAPFRNWLHLMARLKPGVSEDRALANVQPIFRQAAREAAEGLAGLPWLRQGFLQMKVQLEPGNRGLAALRQQFSKPLLVLMTVVGLLLLIACANVASLLLARASARQREIALRMALGAGRRRLVRQLMTESVLLALCGGALGLLFAFWGSSGLLALMSNSPTPVALNVQPDARVLAFTALVSLSTAVLFGLAPAWRATRLDLTPALKEGARSLGSARSSNLGKALVVSQVALSLVLLIGATLLVRSLQKLRDFYPGFDKQNVVLLSVNPSLVGYGGSRLTRLYQDLLDQIKAVPGVRAISFSLHSPMSQHFSFTVPTVQGYTPRPGENTPVSVNIIGPEYFKTLRTPVLLGREFTEADREGAPKVAVINEAMARYFFGDSNPLGRRFSIPGYKGDASPLEIVGVVQDAKFHSLREPSPPAIYVPFFQAPESGEMTFEVRTITNPASVAAAARRVIQQADSRLPVFEVKTLTQQVDESLVQELLVASLSSLFGALALLLASIGLYGLMAYAVSRRTSEIGIRMALGAERSDVRQMVLGEATRLVLTGIGIGLPLALAGARFLSSMLFALSPADPLTISAATLILLAVAAVASFVPARRASLVDPMVALRCE
ncbi:MAG: hypothetical protein DMG26_08875 [Acidobacteria bacterium]|nr:MAG: hypothetical protein DMG26_08875 [Acidobacteriota bacterium]